MAKDPAFLFYPNDWIGGTMGMTFEEKGAYMELLMMQFNRGHMTTHMIGQTVGQLWDNIQDKFVQDADGRWYNERLEQEKHKRKKFTESRRNNLSGNNQYSKNPEKETGHMGGHMTDRMENEDVIESVVKDKDGIDYPFSEKFKEKWKEWKLYLWNEHQQEYKSSQSEKSALKSLVGLSNNIEAKAVKCIDHSMGKRYKGIYEPTSSNGHSKPDEQPVPRSQKPLRRD